MRENWGCGRSDLCTDFAHGSAAEAIRSHAVAPASLSRSLESYRFGVIMSGCRSAWQRSPVGLFRRNDRAQVPESIADALARRPYLSHIQTWRKRIGIIPRLARGIGTASLSAAAHPPPSDRRGTGVVPEMERSSLPRPAGTRAHARGMPRTEVPTAYVLLVFGPAQGG
jgi:hypothetical protein